MRISHPPKTVVRRPRERGLRAACARSATGTSAAAGRAGRPASRPSHATRAARCACRSTNPASATGCARRATGATLAAATACTSRAACACRATGTGMTTRAACCACCSSCSRSPCRTAASSSAALAACSRATAAGSRRAALAAGCAGAAVARAVVAAHARQTEREESRERCSRADFADLDEHEINPFVKTNLGGAVDVPTTIAFSHNARAPARVDASRKRISQLLGTKWAVVNLHRGDLAGDLPAISSAILPANPAKAPGTSRLCRTGRRIRPWWTGSHPARRRPRGRDATPPGRRCDRRRAGSSRSPL